MIIRNASLSFSRIAATFLLLGWVLISPSASSETHTVTLAFEVEGLDLDSGTIVSESEFLSGSYGVDIKISYNADRAVAAVVTPTGTDGVELAFLANTGMDGVSTETLPELIFSSEGTDVSFTVFDTVVVKTDAGTYYKLGDITETNADVTFQYAPVQ